MSHKGNMKLQMDAGGLYLVQEQPKSSGWVDFQLDWFMGKGGLQNQRVITAFYTMYLYSVLYSIGESTLYRIVYHVISNMIGRFIV